VKRSRKYGLLLALGAIVVCGILIISPRSGLFTRSTPPTADYTAVDEAALGDDGETIERWLNKDARLAAHQDVNGDTALHKAAFHGSLRVVEILLKHHAPVDTQNLEGLTPLIIAVRAGQTQVVKVLLEAKANVNIRDREGWTALHWGIAKNRDEIVQLLRAANGQE
jgi:ankyrin repeat protein